jgi:hypothetical protein
MGATVRAMNDGRVHVRGRFTRWRRDPPPLAGLTARAVGHALLIHPSGKPDRRALMFAAGLAADAEHHIVVVDLPDAPQPDAWEQVAQLLANCPGGIRLVIGRPTRETAGAVGTRLADRLGQPVLVPDGRVVAAPGGALFVPAGQGAGWLHCAPGQPARPQSRRFPQPDWDTLTSHEITPVGAGVAEPLPGGVWLRPTGADSEATAHRDRLIRKLSSQRDQMMVVLGLPGAPALQLEDVASYLRSTPPAARAVAQLVHYGPIGHDVARELDQELADRLGEPVVSHPGLPVVDIHTSASGVTDADHADAAVHVGDAAASAGSETKAGPKAGPTLVSSEATAGPTPADPPLPHATRPIRLEAGPELGAPPQIGPLRPAAAADAWPGRPGSTRTADPPRPPEPGRSTEPAPANDRTADGQLRVQPVPQPAASAVPPASGTGRERAWLRRTLGPEHDATASTVTRVLSQSPGLRAGDTGAEADAVTDLVAVKLYLSDTAHLDREVCSATVGPHVPLARCAAAGLRRLPSFRGATGLRATLNQVEWDWYEPGRVVTDWGFPAVHVGGLGPMSGDVDFLIWSITARRTTWLDPTAPEQALFLPGSHFKVLNRRGEPRRTLLLRELADTEIGLDGQVRPGPAALDAAALAGLEQAAANWTATESTEACRRDPLGLLPTEPHFS